MQLSFFFFYKPLLCVCLHGLCICIIVFSGRLAVPVRARVQVVHDPDSAGRSVSFMSSAQFYLKSGSKDERITLIRHDTHALTLAPVSLKNDFLEVWSGNKVVTRWHCGGHSSNQLLKFTLCRGRHVPNQDPVTSVY